MQEYVEIVGPCSKWVEGRGWVTRIPVSLMLSLIEKAGFVRSNSTVKEVKEPVHGGKDDTRSD